LLEAVAYRAIMAAECRRDNSLSFGYPFTVAQPYAILVHASK